MTVAKTTNRLRETGMSGSVMGGGELSVGGCRLKAFKDSFSFIPRLLFFGSMFFLADTAFSAEATGTHVLQSGNSYELTVSGPVSGPASRKITSVDGDIFVELGATYGFKYLATATTGWSVVLPVPNPRINGLLDVSTFEAVKPDADMNVLHGTPEELVEFKKEGEDNARATVKIYMVPPKVTINADPKGMPAKTGWPNPPSFLLEAASTIYISAYTDPPGFEKAVALDIATLSPASPPTGSGTLTQDNTLWKYDSFQEAQTVKHPVSKVVNFTATIYGQGSDAKTHVTVRPVFEYLTIPLYGSIQDYESAWRYAAWKYNIGTPNLASISYAPDQGTPGYTDKSTNFCTIGSGAFNSENWCASTLLHENVHGGQPRVWINACYYAWAEGYGLPFYPEVEAYNAELQHAAETGLSDTEKQGVTAWRDYYNRAGPKPAN